MPRPRRQFFGWYDPTTREFLISLYPPDAPVRPALRLDSMSQVETFREKKRADILWWPPLPLEAMRLTGVN